VKTHPKDDAASSGNEAGVNRLNIASKDTPLQVPEGVPDSAWAKLAKPDGDRWAIAERDASGEVIGTAYRKRDGSKSFKSGGKRGLILDWPLNAYAGTSEDDPIYVCEGASDTAALLGLGLDAIGVPMAGACGAMLAELLSGRHVVIVRDTDPAGIKGTTKIGQALAKKYASVRVIEPPGGAKDARAAVIAGADRVAFQELACKVVSQTTHDSIPSLTERSDRNEYTIVSIVDLGPSAEPDWLWPGYIARGAVTLLTGLWKAGKTTLMGYLLRDFYRGSGLVNTPIDAPTLYISEENVALWANRRDQLELPNSIYFLQRPSFTRPNLADWRAMIDFIVKEVREREIGLVVFDTLPSAWPVQEENDAGEALEALTPLRDVTSAGAAVLLVCHPRKSDGGEGTATRGSGALPAFADVIVELRRHDRSNEGDTRRVLKAYGRFESTPSELVIDLRVDGYTVLGDRPTADNSNAMGKIASVLPESAHGWTVEEVFIALLGTKPGKTRLRALLKVGFDEGRWARVGTGVKNDPHRYYKMTSPDSIQSLSTLSDRNESESAKELVGIASNDCGDA